jgi:hypothetical protein
VKHYLELAFEEGYKIGQKHLTPEVIELMLAQGFRKWWQSGIWDGQQQLVGCTCDRNRDSTLLRAKYFVEFLFEPPMPQK